MKFKPAASGRPSAPGASDDDPVRERATERGAGRLGGPAPGGPAVDFQPRHDLLKGICLGAEAYPRQGQRRTGRGLPADGDLASEAIFLRSACAEAARWPLPARRVSVRLVAGQLNSDGLCPQVTEALALSGLPAGGLELGLSEALLLTLEDDALLALAALHDAGVAVALTDFGQGVASLTLLRRLPFATLKLDRALVRMVETDGDSRSIIEVAAMACRALGITLCAEGVETVAQRALLAELGCQQGQGAAFAPMLLAEAMLDHLMRLLVEA